MPQENEGDQRKTLAPEPPRPRAERDLSLTATEQALYDAYQSWALRIAAQMAQRSQLNSEDAEPLKTAALVGLIQACQRFDPCRGTVFKTMAGMRIAGAVTDCIRDWGWQPRGSYQKGKFKPKCWDGYELTKVSLDASLGTRKHEERGTLRALLPLEDKSLANLERADWVAHLLKQLPEIEREVVRRYYLEDITLKEIGESMGFSESRASQLLGQAVRTLRGRFGSRAMFAESGSGSKG